MIKVDDIISMIVNSIKSILKEIKSSITKITAGGGKISLSPKKLAEQDAYTAIRQKQK